MEENRTEELVEPPEAIQEVAGTSHGPESAGDTSPEELPILAVRDTVLFPGALLPITVGRPASVALVESLGENRQIGIVSQLDPRTEDPAPSELSQTGTVAII